MEIANQKNFNPIQNKNQETDSMHNSELLSQITNISSLSLGQQQSTGSPIQYDTLISKILKKYCPIRCKVFS